METTSGVGALFGQGGLVPLRPLLTGPMLTRLSLVLAGLAFVAVLSAGLPVMMGYDSFVITGGSMSPAVRPGSLIVSARANPAEILPGDVITFRRADRPSAAVTHRVVAVRVAEDGTPIFRTKGDANAAADPEELSGELPLSRMVYTIPYAGYLVAFAATAPGKLLLIVLPGIGLILMSVSAARRAVESRALASVQDRRRRITARQAMREMEPSELAGHVRSHLPRVPNRGAAPGSAGIGELIHGWRARLGGRLSADTTSRAAASRARMAPPAPDTTEDISVAWVARVSGDLTRHVRALDEIRDHVYRETTAVTDLIEDHAAVVADLRANLERKLAPLISYADGLEADLHGLQSSLEHAGADDVSQPLRPYFEEQRRRVVETRAQVERLRRPLEEYIRSHERAIEAVFVPFEGEVRAVEDGLTDQVRILKRMLTGLRSDQFETAIDFLTTRLQEINSLAEAGASEPASIAGSLQIGAARNAELRRESLYLGPVLEALNAADSRAMSSKAHTDRAIAEITPNMSANAAPSLSQDQPNVA